METFIHASPWWMNIAKSGRKACELQAGSA